MLKWKPAHGKQLVCVHWLDADASSPAEAFYEEEIKHRTTSMETYGLLMRHNDEGITVMTEFYQEDDGKHVYRGRTFIPASLVKEVVVLAAPWQPRQKKVVPVNENSNLPS